MAVTRALVQRHHVAYLQVRDAVQRAMGQTWDRVGGADDAALEEWLASAVPIAEAGRNHTAALAAGFLAAAGVKVAHRDPEIRGGAALNEVYARPVIAVRTALSKGSEFLDAMSAGRLRAETIAGTDVMLANRDGMSQADDEGIIGWERVLSGNGCDFCAEVEGAIVNSPDAMPLHNNCECDVVPIMGRRNPVREMNRETVDALGEREPVKVAVHEHGELGPVLTDASDEFTGPRDI